MTKAAYAKFTAEMIECLEHDVANDIDMIKLIQESGEAGSTIDAIHQLLHARVSLKRRWIEIHHRVKKSLLSDTAATPPAAAMDAIIAGCQGEIGEATKESGPIKHHAVLDPNTGETTLVPAAPSRLPWLSDN